MDPVKRITKMDVTSFPNELIPFKQISDVSATASHPRCVCKLGAILPRGFCPCEVKCSVCGSNWDSVPQDDGIAVVYLPTASVKSSLKSFLCSNPQCRNKKCYNGHGDGLIVLYKNDQNEMVIMNAYSMIVIAEDIFLNSMNISDHFEKVRQLYYVDVVVYNMF